MRATLRPPTALTGLFAVAATLPLTTTCTALARPRDPVADYVQQSLQVSRFKRAKADLNGDGHPETFVYVTDQDYCGTSGCLLLLLSPRGATYKVVMRATAVQLPIRLLPTSAHGWRDVGVTVAGGGITRPYVARLRFDGRGYPGNPTIPPAVPLKRPGGTVLIPR